MKFRIEGSAQIYFVRYVEADNADDAWEEAESLFEADLEEDDFQWPPVSMEILDVWEDE
jgi:hypothetical protein